VTNKHAKEVLGWSPDYSSYREGLAKTIADIQADHLSANGNERKERDKGIDY